MRKGLDTLPERRACSRISAAVLIAMTPGLARAATEPQAPAAQSSSAPQDQAANTADESQYPEIVVTAQHRSENIQDVPITIQAFDESVLTTGAIRGVDDLQVLTPGLAMTRSTGATTPFIRGVGTSAGVAGTESAVAIYVDGVYRQSSYSNHLSFSDVQRVEVLKGPQGTLFGRNTTGGVINIVTKDPEQDFQGNAGIAIGNYGIVIGKAYVTGGLADDLSASLSGYMRRQSEGFGTNLVTGVDSKRYTESSGRGKLHFDSGGTRIVLAGDYSRSSDPRGFSRGIIPGTAGGSPAIPTPDLSYAPSNFHDFESNFENVQKSRDLGGSITVEQDLLGFNAISITAWRNSTTNIVDDNDVTKFELQNATIEFADRNFTQEVRLSSDSGSNLDWMLGVFYLDGYSKALLQLPTSLRGFLETKSYAAFGEVGIPLFAGAGKLTLGARYTIDKRRVYGSVAGNPVPGPTVSPTSEWNEPTYRVVYSHDVVPDVMVYASYNRGFKSGSYNIIPVGSAPYNPEIMNAFAIGEKATILGGRGHLNIEAFYYKYSDLQLNISLGSATLTTNAAKATIYGVEGAFDVEVADGLRVNLGATLMSSKYDDFLGAQIFVPNRDPVTGMPTGGNTVQSFDASGTQLVRAPKFSGSAGLTYTVPVRSGNVVAVATGSYSSSFPFEVSGRIKQKAYGVMNASIGYESDDGWALRLEGNNITNTKYYTGIVSVPQSDGYIAADPATFMLAASMNF